MSGTSDLPSLWEEHLRHEFETKNTEETLLTMVEDAYVNHVPVMTGGHGKSHLRQFYSTHFIPQMPDDTQIIPISRTVGEDRLVEEFIFKFTHDIQMDWMLPGIPPTGKTVESPFVVVVQFHAEIVPRATNWLSSPTIVVVVVGILNPILRAECTPE